MKNLTNVYTKKYNVIILISLSLSLNNIYNIYIRNMHTIYKITKYNYDQALYCQVKMSFNFVTGGGC